MPKYKIIPKKFDAPVIEAASASEAVTDWSWASMDQDMHAYFEAVPYEDEMSPSGDKRHTFTFEFDIEVPVPVIERRVSITVSADDFQTARAEAKALAQRTIDDVTYCAVSATDETGREYPVY